MTYINIFYVFVVVQWLSLKIFWEEEEEEEEEEGIPVRLQWWKRLVILKK